MAQPWQADVGKVADWMMQHPGESIDTSSFPDGMLDAVGAEIGVREQHHKDVQAALDKMSPQDKAAASSAPSVVDPKSSIQQARDDGTFVAGLAGGSDALTLGHTDELAGLLGKLEGKDYGDTRDIARGKISQLRSNHPGMYYGMNALGSFQLPAKTGAGPVLGAIAGEGYSNAPIDSPKAIDDASFGGLLGGAAEAGANALGSTIKAGAGALAKKMAGSFKVSPALLRYLGFNSEEISKLMAMEEVGGAADHGSVEAANMLDGPTAGEITQAAQKAAGDIGAPNSQFPYLSPQKIKDNIAVPSIAAERVNPDMSVPSRYDPSNAQVNLQVEPAPVAPQGGGWTPQAGPPKEINFGPPAQEMEFDPASGYTDWKDQPSPWQNATAEELNNIMPAGPKALRDNPRAMPVKPLQQKQQSVPATDLDALPSQPPLNPASRAAAKGFGVASDKPSQGLQPTKAPGFLAQMFNKNIAGPTAIGIPKVGELMLRKLDSFGQGVQAGQTDGLKAVINHVLSSPDPSFSDYLAKETFPWYLALHNQVVKEEEGK